MIGCCLCRYSVFLLLIDVRGKEEERPGAIVLSCRVYPRFEGVPSLVTIFMQDLREGCEDYRP